MVEGVLSVGSITKQKNDKPIVKLTNEQDMFLQDALKGYNVLVDACVGSGKTTAIQALCNAVPKSKKVLYLTYSRLLKIDAQSKIKNSNVTVQNYNGFAYRYAKVGFEEQIKTFLSLKPDIGHYDMLVLDEYQDINQEISEMLTYIKSKLPNLQITAVGDMQQKIQDKGKFDVSIFIIKLLGENYTKRDFTICFRLNKSHAGMLSRVWNKPIVGANRDCIVEHVTEDEAFALLLDNEPRDILCLGSRTGRMYKFLDDLEDAASYKFNKNTVYASIRDKDGNQADLNNDIAIFTTFDSSKGLERKICVIFDFDTKYWGIRLNHPDQSYEILRNIFCVAASRGKSRIVFVSGANEYLDEETLSAKKDVSLDVVDYPISGMFDFKKKYIDEPFEYLNIIEIAHDGETSELNIKRKDGRIDLSPCIGIFQEADFFEGYDIDKAIKHQLRYGSSKKYRSLYQKTYQAMNIEEKVLFLTSLETNLERYRTQVQMPFVKEEDRKLISDRLAVHFTPYEDVQVRCSLSFFISNTDKSDIGDFRQPYFRAKGIADIVKNNIVYELKFVSHVERTHFLQLACYVVALGLKKGKLINILDNRIYEITVSKKSKFLEAVAHAVTKQRLAKFKIQVGKKADDEIMKHMMAESKKWESQRKLLSQQRELETKLRKEAFGARRFRLEEYSEDINDVAVRFALIDVETSYAEKVISIGIVISDDVSFNARKFKYFRITEHENTPAMYSESLDLGLFVLNPKEHESRTKYLDAIKSIKQLLSDNGVKNLFAYNANFDKRHLPELRAFCWHDIIEKAAYKQTNKKIPADSDFYGTGRLKRGYSMEAMYRLLTEDVNYLETHNALIDAFDELEIMKLLKFRVARYKVI